ncbi:MAG: hypothetical protein F6K40_07470 [Okeania sp. SIO3I5]|uniref:hypothetical protein n=1 Tax=Okeania sp. SIO3I5 TaxID=2607805 RepID=UPI0013B7EDEE|nr:hypothetical protein [Okeania sp. SIO3I5]NEQ36132.1 hypothetical protein [Okeania sp. SIO3I5]
MWEGWEVWEVWGDYRKIWSGLTQILKQYAIRRGRMPFARYGDSAQVLLAMLEDGIFFYTELSGFDIIRT